MNIQQLRSQFTAFLFLADPGETQEMKGAFVEAGYESFVFSDQQQLIERLHQAAPHVIIFTPAALESPLSDFVSSVLQANSEVQFICVSSTTQSQTLQEYREYNLSSLVPLGEHLPLRVVWAMDQVCEYLYRSYQNEQLLENSEKLSLRVQDAESQLTILKKENALVSQVSVKARLERLEKAQSKDELLSLFLSGLPCYAIFFKYLPTVNSFVATASQGLEIDSLKGVGSRLDPAESQQLFADLEANKLPKALVELMTEGLRVHDYLFRPLKIHRGLDGLFIFWAEKGLSESVIENEFLIFQMLYQNAHLAKRFESLDIMDSVTELFNRNYFLQKLEEEIHRAKRLSRAVSLVTLSIDHLTEIESSFGRNNRDLILRTIASIIKKTSRVNDLSCRTEDNEFSLILPHCSRKGAALRAERLRRIIEGHAFAITDLKITISCGVSEYPTLSLGASDLEVSAGQALEFILARGGNKVCLFKPTQEFKPDFEVPPM